MGTQIGDKKKPSMFKADKWEPDRKGFWSIEPNDNLWTMYGIIDIPHWRGKGVRSIDNMSHPWSAKTTTIGKRTNSSKKDYR